MSIALHKTGLGERLVLILDSRAALIRNTIVAAANGAIALTLLLIAPLGLATVITLTALIVVSTFGCLFVADWVVRFLFGSRQATRSVYGALDRQRDRPIYDSDRVLSADRDRRRLR
ncbi:CRISPR-associated protein Csx18 [Synechococcus elongatus IITB4]|uniref:CRISPR-associated protein Csx18 n=1 Tax=Synechococcus elongatus TaxID=32046 RepID=UPI0030D05216